MRKQQGLSLIEVMVRLVLVRLAVTGLVSQAALLSDQFSKLTQINDKARFAGRIMHEVRRAFTVEPYGCEKVRG